MRGEYENVLRKRWQMSIAVKFLVVAGLLTVLLTCLSCSQDAEQTLVPDKPQGSPESTVGLSLSVTILYQPKEQNFLLTVHNGTDETVVLIRDLLSVYEIKRNGDRTPVTLSPEQIHFRPFHSVNIISLVPGSSYAVTLDVLAARQADLTTGMRVVGVAQRSNDVLLADDTERAFREIKQLFLSKELVSPVLEIP